MPSLPVRPRQIAVAGALAAAVALTGAGLSAAAPSAPDEKVQVVHVTAPSQQERSRVNALGLDTTEHGDSSGVEVVLHSAADARKLRAAGFSWRVEDADLGATVRKAAGGRPGLRRERHGRRRCRAAARRTARMHEVNAELDALAQQATPSSCVR